MSLSLCCSLLSPAGVAQTARRADENRAAVKSEGVEPSTAKEAAPASSSSDSGSSKWQFWTNLIIPPGAGVNLDSVFEYSSSKNVRVTIRSANNDLDGLFMEAYWATPGLPFYNTAELVTGDQFHYANVGGATFNTYGTQLRLRISNNGPTIITLLQVLVFAPGR